MVKDEYSLISRAKDMGVTAEIYSVEVSSIQYKKDRQAHFFNLRDTGYGLRVIKDGKVGFAHSNLLDDSLLEMAIETMKLSKEDKFNVLPYSKPVNKINLKFFDIEEVREKLLEFSKQTEEAKDYANVVNEYYEAVNSKIKIISTEGMDVEEERSLVGMSIVYNFKIGDYVSPEIYEGISSRDIGKLDVQRGIMDKIVTKRNLYKNMNKERLKFNSVILTPKAVSSLFIPLLMHSLSLENKFRGKSILKDEEILNESLTLIDNPSLSHAPGSRSFDGEGLPSKIVQLIERGKVRNFLSNTYWSLKANRENTHSAGRSYSTLPSISPSVIDIQVSSSADEETIVVDEVQGVHTSNFDTGDFSLVASVSWYKDSALRELTISGNIKDLAKNIVGALGEKEMVWNVHTKSLFFNGVNLV
ncbi:TldD/PmbA family protein [Sulfolobus acidocaldarius]|uniref:Conserved Archaeal protein n=4 Tax=Sulfolobus acidocaldarius TaxID=2285 RepID=Q4J8D2_SULAC|nr:TldD/PmbA family protein [Sulfolobus acidocaldarius]AAY80950.1 conserved Archaeal protein [Sulfolobus acidocaldarius DSM 639]AGE71551.1 hypothetical protein SacN8_07955 [Sulfolobus acidocaldarius N8]AGE73824.1 hypothetical protein SacRon12I_07965 [Sulfolobus acidocaldarius Ron12/I]ALU30222.1 hypothetical protein ATY89_09920 [Sulfolobus acidocaldarius]ALU30937.1 hypothetical protein ATZ20_01475 [Sulfolobus acidocaldarius]